MPLAFHAILICAGTVFLGEIGDKTQLLLLLLACRYRCPLPLIAGILAAAVVAGTWLHQVLDPQWLRWITRDLVHRHRAVDTAAGHLGCRRRATDLGARLVLDRRTAFFLAEIGDKTQIATVLLAARFDTIVPVVVGTTLGMLLADVPVVLFGERIAARLPVAWVWYGHRRVRHAGHGGAAGRMRRIAVVQHLTDVAAECPFSSILTFSCSASPS